MANRFVGGPGTTCSGIASALENSEDCSWQTTNAVTASSHEFGASDRSRPLCLCDIAVGGVRPWDIRVHDERFFRRILAARRASQTIRFAGSADYAQMRAGGPITGPTAIQALSMLEIDEDGFYEMVKRIIECLVSLFNDGPVGLNSLAVAIGEDAGTLEGVHEPRDAPLYRAPTANSASNLHGTRRRPICSTAVERIGPAKRFKRGHTSRRRWSACVTFLHERKYRLLPPVARHALTLSKFSR
jgi:hypothetical protein